MKLHELGAQRQTEQVARVIETRLGRRIDFAGISESQARRMLQKVQGLLREYKTCVSRHFSERNPDYLQLIMMEQGLTHRLAENMAAAPMAVDVDDPKTQAVLRKAQSGQNLSSDEQKTITALASMKKEDRTDEKYMGFDKLEKAIKKGGSARDPGAVAAAIGRKKYGKERFQKAAAAGRKLGESRLIESEIQQAQVVLAAQDMVDQMQKILEQISAMQFKDLPALTDAIKNDMGVEQATQFQQQASQSLTSLLQSVQQSKTELEGAQGVLTGQAPQVPGSAAQLPPSADVDADLDADLSLDANLPGEDEDEQEEIEVTSLGREKR